MSELDQGTMFRPLMHSIAPGAGERDTVINHLGLSTEPNAEADAFAEALAAKAHELSPAAVQPIAIVNLVNDKQRFLGLYVPPDHSRRPLIGRQMEVHHGWCPHVISRGKALVLDDVCEYPRFVGNPVVDKVGIRTYNGAPLIHVGRDGTKTAFGTVCIIDDEPRRWGPPGLDLIKDAAATYMRKILREAGL